MDYYVGVTDLGWFRFLSQIKPEDVNFWQPGGRTTFRAVQAGAPFLFKLKHPLNAIGGVGFFSTHSFLPIRVAWEIFDTGNGVETFEQFYNLISQLRSKDNSLAVNPNIGCIVLTNPIFFEKEDWVSIPENWSNSIVQGKSYSTEDPIGSDLWRKVENNLSKYNLYDQKDGAKSQLLLEDPQSHYGQAVLTKVRLGQGAFRVMLTNAYRRKCAISGEKTLPVLEAAHIKPFAKSGPHFISNGLLLRADLHKLFDSGYITVTKDMRIEISNRIKEEFENGKEYYRFHGQNLNVMPERDMDKPSAQFIDWHNSNIFK